MIAYRCPYNKKHEDHKRCFCQREILEKKRKEKEPLTEKQIQNYKNKFSEIKKDLEKRGFFSKNKTLQEEEKKRLNWAEDRKCIICGEDLTENLANVCSGDCMKERDNK
jgi:hypothetical protein